MSNQDVFCCCCGHSDKKLMPTPARCEYDGWGPNLCSDCCEACSYHQSCAERYGQAEIVPPNAVPAPSMDLLVEARADLKAQTRRIAEASSAARPP